MTPAGSILVFGPAYLDRVLRVDRPLLDPALGWPPLDRSVDGRWVAAEPADSIRLVDPAGAAILVSPPDGWPALTGTIALARRLADRAEPVPVPRRVRGVAWVEDLGGMGAGFAASLGGTLISALGAEGDPTSRAIVARLDRAGIAHEPTRLATQSADWTLLISSGAHGDKLPIGFRGCHAAWTDLARWADRPSQVRVAAALPNPLVRAALGGPARLRACFPNSRNMLDGAEPITQWVDRVDFLSCNRGEWADLGAGAALLDGVPIVAVTDGPRGATVRFRSAAGGRGEIHVPAFRRTTPILDTNRAGEAFASTMLATLVATGWTPGPVAPDLVRRAAWRGSAAAALVLGRADFGFATPGAIDAAVERGAV